jgi:diguanylate cyclase (GGDEF)-like protein
MNTDLSPHDTLWDPDLVEAVYRILYRSDLDSRGLDAALGELEQDYQEEVYTELLYLLTHLRFGPTEAKHHWIKIREHRDRMEMQQGKPVDLRVSLVSYFVEVNRQLKNPKIIELKLFEKTREFAYKDELTGLYNFRYFREHLDREIERAARYNTPVSLAMIDIDDFKSYNDRYGHESGNEALAMIARILSDSFRKIDVLARYGGEEFVLILPSTLKIHAHLVAERARESIESHRFGALGSHPGETLTVSMGIAAYPADARGGGDLVQRADSAMYLAKARGKNQVHLYGENRRSFRRVEARLPGSFSTMGSDHPLTTLNISEGGFSFVTGQELPVGTLVETRLQLPDDGEITASGRVVRVQHTEDGMYEVAFRIMDTADRSQLVKYLREAAPSSEPAAMG